MSRIHVVVGGLIAAIVAVGCESATEPPVSARHTDAAQRSEDSGASRYRTEDGIAVLDLMVSPDQIIPDAQISVRAANRGDVPLVVDPGFVVERRSKEGSWDAVSLFDSPRSQQPRRELGPDESTAEERWPVGEAGRDALMPGRYRVVKKANIVASDGTVDGSSLTARREFRVRSPNWDAPPQQQDVGVVRMDTEDGEAAISLKVRPHEIAPTGQVSIQLVNRGELTVLAGRHLNVERWNGNEWVPPQQAISSTSVGIPLVRNQKTDVRRWPDRSGDDYEPLEPGWYRVIKPAAVEAVGEMDIRRQLEARAVFRVR